MNDKDALRARSPRWANVEPPTQTGTGRRRPGAAAFEIYAET